MQYDELFSSNRFTRAQVDVLRRLSEQLIEEADPVTTVAGLGDPTIGLRRIVTDATATTFHSIVAGGGANVVPVFGDGSDWRIG